jgi:ribonuclease P protein component
LIWRIRERSGFTRLAVEGQRTRAGVLWCTFVLDPINTPPQVAFALGRALGPAVVRNRIRRRLRHLLAAAPPPAGMFLIGAQPIAGSRSASELAFDLAKLLDRLRAASVAR